MVLCAPLRSPCSQDSIESNGKTLLVVTHGTRSDALLPSAPPSIVGADCPRHATWVTELSPREKISSLLPIFSVVIATTLNKVVTIMTVVFCMRDEGNRQSALTTINCAHAVSSHGSVS